MNDDNGQLHLNSDVIFRNTNGEQGLISNTIHDIAPRLFLEQASAQESRRRQANADFLNTVENQIFLYFENGPSFITDELVADLFQIEEETMHFGNPPTTPVNYFQMPLWLVALLGVIAGGVVNYLVALLGRRFAKMIFGKQGVENYEHKQ